MATGYRIRRHTDSGNGRIGYAAGSLITVLDDLLTVGGNNWSKTVNATNDVTYQAPAGSQVKLRVYDTTSGATTFPVRLTGQVGSGTVFPTATQESVSSQGYATVRKRENTNTGTGYDPGYIGIRTDRFMLLLRTLSTSFTFGGGIFMAGDLPTYVGTDPGLCAVLGSCGSNSLTNTNYANENSFPSAFQSLYATSTGLDGYANVGHDGVTAAVPLFVRQILPNGGLGTVANSLSKLTLGPLMVYTSNTTTQYNLSTTSMLRGRVPFVYTIAESGGAAAGDTFTDGNGASYEVVTVNNGTQRLCALMTSDSETGLP